MKVKKTKLPENLYHYTSLIKYRMILATGKLLLTPSNLKYDNATLHDEPLFFNGQKIGYKSVDKYENYHPVVWLTANDHAGAKNTGLSNDMSAIAKQERSDNIYSIIFRNCHILSGIYDSFPPSTTLQETIPPVDGTIRTAKQ